jgi:hypothetical protein
MAESSAGESSSSKSLLWMMLAFFAGLSILLGGGFFLASRIMRTVGLSASMNKDTVRTPIGSFRMEKESAVGPGLPLYPHASLILPGEEASAEAIQNAKRGMDSVNYHSPDLRDSVDNWYSKHLGPEFKRHDAGETPLPDIFRDVRVSDNDIAFVAERGQQVRIVALSLDATGTKISLIRFDKPAAQ